MKRDVSFGLNKWKEPFWINILGMLLMGLTSLGYVCFKRSFAEMNILLPFYDGLPLFIGEILWFSCFFLAGIKLLLFRRDILARYWLGPVLYGVWLLLKTLFGLWHFGPLALRHAALFYYPVFFIFGFLFFDRRLFSRPVMTGLLCVVCIVFFWRRFDTYWTFSLLALSSVLLMHLYSWRMQVFWGFALVLTVPYYTLFSTARMMLLGNAVAALLLVTAFWRFVSFSRVYRLGVIVAVIGGCFFLAQQAYKVFPPDRVFVTPLMARDAFVEWDRSVRERQTDFVRQQKLVPVSGGEDQPLKEIADVRLYAPEQKSEIPFDAPSPEEPEGFKQWHSVNNIVFRLMIWRDMAVEWWGKKPWLGFSFGHPLRSPSLEALRWAESEWKRDGWIEPHNSFLNILYRSGVPGVFFIMVLFWVAVLFLTDAFRRRSWRLVLLAAVIWSWLVAANFLVILEMPYTAIPFWTLFGMSSAYAWRHEAGS